MAIVFARASFRVVHATLWNDDVQVVDKDTGVPVDLTGIAGIVMRMRSHIDGPIVLELSQANGRIVVLNAIEGRIGIRVPTAVMQGLPLNKNRRATYVYDALIERTADEYEAGIAGKVTVLPQVTRPYLTT